MILTRNAVVLMALFLCPILLSFLSKFDFSNYIPAVNIIDEVVLILLLQYAINGFLRILRNKRWIYFLFFFVGYVVIGLVSAILNEVPVLQVLHQLVISLKFPYLLMVLLGQNKPLELFFAYLKLAKIILVICLMLIIWQLLDGSSYDDFFSNGFHKNTLLLGGGVQQSRGVGVFSHPGQMAIFSGTLTIFFFYIFMSSKLFYYRNSFLWLLISGLALFLTFSRLEIFATIVALISTYFLTSIGGSKYVKRVLKMFFIIGIGFLIYPVLSFIYIQSVPIGIFESLDPRVVFAVKGMQIASDYFPFGSGLGTYGGYIAAVYNSPIYIDYGFQNYYWYLQGHFMGDTFWSHILGESGFLGFFLYFCSLIFIIFRAVGACKRDHLTLLFAQMVIASTFLISINSFATPDMTSVMSLAQCFIPLSVVFYMEKMCDF